MPKHRAEARIAVAPRRMSLRQSWTGLPAIRQRFKRPWIEFAGDAGEGGWISDSADLLKMRLQIRSVCGPPSLESRQLALAGLMSGPSLERPLPGLRVGEDGLCTCEDR